MIAWSDALRINLLNKGGMAVISWRMLQEIRGNGNVLNYPSSCPNRTLPTSENADMFAS